jgi:predicted GH43/DUF377 family glycosyl hydrolase
MTSVDPTKLWSVPSFVHQGWESGLFDFGKALKKGVDYFNCAFLQRNAELWLIVRRAEWGRRDAFGYNSLMAFSISPDTLRPHIGYAVHMGKSFDIEHFEDPRAYFVKGRTFVSACNFIRNPGGMRYPHQVICELNDDWTLNKRYDPIYSKNGKSVADNLGHEKNWTWFWERDTRFLNYSPGVVAEFTHDFKWTGEEWKTEVPDENLWAYGIMRGGSPPVFHNGEYWTFFHSAVPWKFGRRQYHTGAYAFEPKPPFRITKITIDPLLSGSVDDGGTPDKPPCLFVCSAILIGNKWLLSFGVNDHSCGWCKIPHKELEDRMIQI